MRLMTSALLCLCMLVSYAYAEPPTKTIANGGWFALTQGPGYPDTASTYCGGLPCTDQSFANHFGPSLSGAIIPGTAVLYPARGTAELALKNGEFGLTGPVCQPGIDSGQSATLVSGYVQLYQLGHFSAVKLTDSGLFQNGEFWLQNYLNGISGELSNQGLGGLIFGSNQLIDQQTGLPSDQFNSPVAFGNLSVVLYDAVKRWAGQLGLAVQAYKVRDLRALDFICP